MKLKVYSSNASSNQEIDFDKVPVFEGNKGRQALKEVIVAYHANARQGNACTKTRGEVSGGGRKPWRQKGTGNARAGSNTSPLWNGGGIVFGPRPRDYSKKINGKVKSLALRRIFFDRAAAGEIDVIEEITFSQAKTRLAHELLRKIAPEGKVLIVEDSFSPETVRALRNLPYVSLQEVSAVNARDLAGHNKIIFTRKALDRIFARFNEAS